jgi:hypothetical protein
LDSKLPAAAASTSESPGSPSTTVVLAAALGKLAATGLLLALALSVTGKTSTSPDLTEALPVLPAVPVFVGLGRTWLLCASTAARDSIHCIPKSLTYSAQSISATANMRPDVPLQVFGRVGLVAAAGAVAVATKLWVGTAAIKVAMGW